ncbi:MAG TPA: RNA polymerase sigma factor [Gammaproteobacteria bacterium]|nr:RNA polymerase sigma factor [Gammaproteobacteria bacterium]
MRVARTTQPEEPAPNLEAAKPAKPISPLRFKLAVLQHDRAVYRFARTLLRDEREAEDVVQETFLRYWQHGGGVRKPREWLFKVARNACLDRFRRAGRFVSHEAAAPPEPADERDPQWHYEQRELEAGVLRLLDTLPEPQRSLVVLFDLHGVDGAGCAAILGLSTTQVKVYLHRARRRLRERLEHRS